MPWMALQLPALFRPAPRGIDRDHLLCSADRAKAGPPPAQTPMRSPCVQACWPQEQPLSEPARRLVDPLLWTSSSVECTACTWRVANSVAHCCVSKESPEDVREARETHERRQSMRRIDSETLIRAVKAALWRCVKATSASSCTAWMVSMRPPW